jgi:hypothetical protein
MIPVCMHTRILNLEGSSQESQRLLEIVWLPDNRPLADGMCCQYDDTRVHIQNAFRDIQSSVHPYYVFVLNFRTSARV